MDYQGDTAEPNSLAEQELRTSKLRICARILRMTRACLFRQPKINQIMMLLIWIMGAVFRLQLYLHDTPRRWNIRIGFGESLGVQSEAEHEFPSIGSVSIERHNPKRADVETPVVLKPGDQLHASRLVASSYNAVSFEGL
ncbi:hypothetical protein KCU83_g542, partial [Aureobasidium melanogenum]